MAPPIQGLAARIQARLAALGKSLTATPTRTAATAGAGLTAAGIAGTAGYNAMQAPTGSVPGANEAMSGMTGKMETPIERNPAPKPPQAPSASGTTQSPGSFFGKRVASTGAKMGLVGGLGLAVGVGAGAMAGRRAKKKQPGNMGKTTLGAEKMAEINPLLATGIALPGVLGAVGAFQGVRKAPRGRKLAGAGKGAVKGIGGGLGALAGLGAGALGGLSAGAGLEGAGHPDMGALAQRGLTFGGGLAGHALGSSLAEKLVGSEDDDGYHYKVGADTVCNQFETRPSRRSLLHRGLSGS